MTWATVSDFGTQSRKVYLATRTWRAYGTSQGNASGTVLCLVGSARSRSLSRRLSPVRLCSVLLFSGTGNTRWYLVCGMSDSGGTLLWGVNVAANAVKWFMGSSFSYINACVAKSCKHTMLFSCRCVKIISSGRCLYAYCARRPNTENQSIPV